jgi:hypothetical protein
MLADNQRLAVRLNHSLRALEFTLYEYALGMRYEKAHAVPFEHLSQPAFHVEDLLSFLQSKMPSAFPSYDAFLVAKSLDFVWA